MKMNNNYSENNILSLIEKTFKFPSDKNLILGPGDDCAVLKLPAGNISVTTDEIVEGTHYLAEFADPEEIARKIMRVNLSDLASMGNVQPITCLVGAGLTKETEFEFIKRFILRLKKEALKFNITIAGGNLAAARENHFYITVFGKNIKKPVLRDGVKAGDVLLNVGLIGEAKAGLEILKAGNPKEKSQFKKLINSFWRPVPMLKEGKIIGNSNLAAAMLDNSDGLLKSAKILSSRSGLKCVLDVRQDCCSKVLKEYCLKNNKDWRSYVIDGGEDYGLIFTVAEKNFNRIKKLLPNVKKIGYFTKGEGVEIKNFDGEINGFEHFSK